MNTARTTMERVMNKNVTVHTENMLAHTANIDMLVFQFPLTAITKPFSIMFF